MCCSPFPFWPDSESGRARFRIGRSSMFFFSFPRNRATPFPSPPSDGLSRAQSAPFLAPAEEEPSSRHWASSGPCTRAPYSTPARLARTRRAPERPARRRPPPRSSRCVRLLHRRRYHAPRQQPPRGQRDCRRDGRGDVEAARLSAKPSLPKGSSPTRSRRLCLGRRGRVGGG
jgi:hypothetical protein